MLDLLGTGWGGRYRGIGATRGEAAASCAADKHLNFLYRWSRLVRQLDVQTWNISARRRGIEEEMEVKAGEEVRRLGEDVIWSVRRATTNLDRMPQHLSLFCSAKIYCIHTHTRTHTHEQDDNNNKEPNDSGECKCSELFASYTSFSFSFVLVLGLVLAGCNYASCRRRQPRGEFLSDFVFDKWLCVRCPTPAPVLFPFPHGCVCVCVCAFPLMLEQEAILPHCSRRQNSLFTLQFIVQHL